ncbi:putative ribosomal N-acetyltransferase YdaF [Streptomyces sp. ADI98-12]|uniref:Acetyltransferase n=2 Tax=Streptomyces TaxID=1883 RepID=A0A380MQR8_STRGR|nr:GNAT family N-acetyltransferase [Streptomyces rutgersensis]RPK86560.1 putative ribosomal N-acetyltransferase YdaF [Streptomyces sp. ADI98-12]SUO94406.1 Acetyltransferase [Streptomyces griseus]
MEPITLTTARLTLRTLTEADVDPVYQACQDPEIRRWTTVPSPYRRADAEHFVTRICEDGWREGTEFTFGAVDTVGYGALVAVIGLSMRGTRTGEVGFWTARQYRGRGLMTEAVRAVAGWAFTEIPVDRVIWRAEVGNTASRATALRVGFVPEGVERAGLLNNGVRRDCWVAALLPSDLGLPSTDPYLPAPTTTANRTPAPPAERGEPARQRPHAARERPDGSAPPHIRPHHDHQNP